METTEDVQALRLLERLDAMKIDRAGFEYIWNLIQAYVQPRRGSVYGEETPGQHNGQKIYNSAPEMAANRMVAALNSMLTNVSSIWFNLEVVDTRNMTQQYIKIYAQKLEELERGLRRLVESTNFYIEIPEFYSDLVSIGTACLYSARSSLPDSPFYYSTRHMKEIFLDENELGLVNTVFRLTQMTTRELVEDPRFEGKLPDMVTEGIENQDHMNKKWNVLHATLPRTAADFSQNVLKLATKKPWASYWVLEEAKKVIYEGGYDEFPYVVVRWRKTVGEKYGRSPAWMALADIMTLNEMEKTLLNIAQLTARPPMDVPERSYLNSFEMIPGYMNIRRFGTQDRVEAIDVGGNVPVGEEMCARKIEAVENAFLANNLHLIDKREMTAAEVRQRTAENMRILGPTFSRLELEFLPVWFKRLMGLARRTTDLFENIDRDLETDNLRVRYSSPIAKSQRRHEVEAIEHLVGIVNTWSVEGQQPELQDELNKERAIQAIADLIGAPKEVLNDEKEKEILKQQREQDAKMQRDAVAAETAGSQGAAAKSMAEAAATIQESGGML
jgi:hypothetical protein